MDSLKHFATLVMAILPTVLIALLVLLIGLKMINCAAGWLKRRLEAINTRKHKQSSLRSIRNMFRGGSQEANDNEEELDLERAETHRIDPTLMRFAVSFASNGLKILLLITVASMVNISTASFVAVLSMCSLAIGLALQGLLKDLAAGVMLLVFRRYDVGDLVDFAGVKSKGILGRVAEIALFETVVRTLDNKTITVPNSQIKVTTNLSEQRTLRVDVAVKIAHGTPLRAAKTVLLDLLLRSPSVLQEPAPVVLVSQIDELGKELTMRVWLRNADYIPVPFTLREEGVLALEEAGLALACWPPLAATTASASASALPAGTILPTLLTSRAPAALCRAAGPCKTTAAAVGEEDEG